MEWQWRGCLFVIVKKRWCRQMIRRQWERRSLSLDLRGLRELLLEMWLEIVSFDLLFEQVERLVHQPHLVPQVRAHFLLQLMHLGAKTRMIYSLESKDSNCRSYRSLRSVTYSLVTSDTDSSSSITHSVSTSASGFCTGSGRIFFSTLPNFVVSVLNWLFALST